MGCELERKTYPLLGQTTGTLVLGVSEQFDDTLLVWGKAAGVLASVKSTRAKTVDFACIARSESVELACVTYPATSRVISLTKAVRLDRKPFLLEILGAGVLGVTSVG
jgi:hypothetical protein